MKGDFSTIRTVGTTLPAELLERVVAGDTQLGRLSAADYHLAAGETPRAAAHRAWSYLKQAWVGFRGQIEGRRDDDPLIGVTRDQWLHVVLRELDYGRVPQTPAGGIVVDERAYPVSHEWGALPIHLLGWNVPLDRRSKGVPGAADRAPHAMVQELLNRSEDRLWGILANGRSLRLLRDSTNLTGVSYVEFDLETMFDHDVFSDFVVLYLLCHQSRFEVGEGQPQTACPIETWRSTARDLGVRARQELREGVARALELLGNGFLTHPANTELRRRLSTGEMTHTELHRELMQLVYRLLFLFVVEDRPERDLVLDPAITPAQRERWSAYYSSRVLRRRALVLRRTRHGDEWQRTWTVLRGLGGDGIPELGVTGLGGLFAPTPGETLAAEALTPADRFAPLCQIGNDSFLAAVRALSVIRLKGQPEQVVDFGRLGAEELGGIYESLLELVPHLDTSTWTLSYGEYLGNDRKTTGSYYTPSDLIDLVLDEALDPLLDEAERADDPDAALLAMTVCDPACGSGHFLVAAARRIAERVALVRSETRDLLPGDLDAAMRDVVVRCIYGVDLQPMAAQLAKVALWLESMERGKPLAFLDHHIKVGNSLLGATPALLSRGVPDGAYAALTGDDKKVAAALKKQNRTERVAKQSTLLSQDDDAEGIEIAPERVRALQAVVPQRTAAEVAAVAERFRALESDDEMTRARRAADTWCSAFTAWKVDSSRAITTETVRNAAHGTLPAVLGEIVSEEATRYRFFHWHLEFPEVFTPLPADDIPDDDPTGWAGGFTAMLGNPPWDRVKLQEKEFFAHRDAAVAAAPNAAARKRLITALVESNPTLAAEWQDAVHQSEATSALLRVSGRFPLCGTGDVNTYSVFAELFRSSLSPAGRMGIITPTGLATDATTSAFFADTIRARRLVTFYDFDNEAKIFANVHHAFRFAVTAMTGGRPADETRLAFLVRSVADVADRRFELSADEILRINPNTGTLPLFRTRRDAEITLAVYRRFPILIDDATGTNPWGLRFMRMFDMANDSGLFRTGEQLAQDGAEFDGWAWTSGPRRWVPLYEAKMLGHYDHRFSTYRDATQAQLNVGSLPRPDATAHDDPSMEPLARYWIHEREVDKQLDNRWDRDWLLGWRDIARASDARTCVPSAMPISAVGGGFYLAFPRQGGDGPLLEGVWSSFAYDFLARQKVSGAHLNLSPMRQLACPTPGEVAASLRGVDSTSYAGWLRPRVLELTYTSWRMAPFAIDCLELPDGTDPGPPFRWIPERREQLRAEIDAAMFHLYGMPREDVEHVMDSFAVVRKYDERDHGEFRTKRLILEIYDAMADAAARGTVYTSPLDPPPGDGPRHPVRGDA